MRLAAAAFAAIAWLVPAAHAAPGEADVARAAEEVFRGVNAFRRAEGLAEARPDAHLEDAAREFARYMAKTGRYGHEADGRDPPTRAQAHGYDYCLVLENIAYHYDSRGFDTGSLARHVVDGWKASPPHRKNMLDPSVVHMGVAIARSASSGYYYSVQMLGLPRSAAIQFDVRNESQRPVRYHVGSEPYTIPRRSVRTHLVCAAKAVGFTHPTATFEAKGGERFVIAPDGSGVRRVER